jgi:hypothetical protein
MDSSKDAFKGQEYIGLYPLFERPPTTAGGEAFVVRTPHKYMILEDFAAGRQSYRDFA